jgi:muramoyltetrapeptide carboxypeptidase
MKRKEFLSSVVPLAAAVSSVAKGKLIEDPDPGKVPVYLKSGAIIGITCPSGAITSEEVQSAVNKMKDWGFEIQIGQTVGLKDFTFAGTDEQRAKDFQQMLDDDSIDAIMLGRGGYGAVRIIDAIDFTKFRKKPKWIIGFSDATVFHSHINSNFKIATIHSKMCNSFPDDWSTATPEQIDSINSIQKCLAGEKMEYKVSSGANNRNGNAKGVLVGGNLSILQNLAGTKSEIDTANKILFIEDTEEYLYNIDRMLWNLKRSNKFSKLKGLIVGGFTNIKPDDPGEEFGRTVYDMVMGKVKEYDYPVCFDFPVGHQKENYALKCGVMHRLIVSDDGVMLRDDP